VKTLILVMAVYVATTASALAEPQTTFRDASGRTTGTASRPRLCAETARPLGRTNPPAAENRCTALRPSRPYS
jgi:hypothetical protein